MYHDQNLQCSHNLNTTTILVEDRDEDISTHFFEKSEEETSSDVENQEMLKIDQSKIKKDEKEVLEKNSDVPEADQIQNITLDTIL